MTNADLNRLVNDVDLAVDELNARLARASSAGLCFRLTGQLSQGYLDQIFVMGVNFRDQPKEDRDG